MLVEEITKTLNLDLKFAESFTEAGGKFVYCENHRDMVAQLEELKMLKGWNHIFEFEESVKDLFQENDFQRNVIGYFLENSDVAVSKCAGLVAEDGTIIFSSDQASRRRLHIFPPTHIIIADLTQIYPNMEEGLERFKIRYKNELPSLLDLRSSSVNHQSINNTLVLNANGFKSTKDVYVFLCDEGLKN